MNERNDEAIFSEWWESFGNNHGCTPSARDGWEAATDKSVAEIQALRDRVKELESEPDEDVLTSLFCDAVGCRDCHGSDHNGEPNGYGCPGMEKWRHKAAEALKEKSDD